MIFLNNAATSFPKPPVVIEKVNEWLTQGVGSPGRGEHSTAAKVNNAVDQARTKLARFFGIMDESRVVFTYSATDALNLAIKGLLEQGDHVIISSMEHNSVLRPLRGMEEAGFISLEIVPCSEEGFVKPEDVFKCFNEKTRLVVMNHASNVTGAVQPVAQIGQGVRERGAYFLVDAAQSAGVLSTNLMDLNADMLAFAGHKGIFGLQGTGALIVGPRIQKLKPFREGGTGFNSRAETQPLNWPEAYEAGTPNTPGIISMAAGIDFIETQGLDKINEIEQNHFYELWNGLRKLSNVRLLGPEPGQDRVAVLSFTIEDWDLDDISQILYDNYKIHVRSGLHCSPLAHKTAGTYPDGAIRVSPGIFTTRQEIKTFVSAIKILADTQVSF